MAGGKREVVIETCMHLVISKTNMANAVIQATCIHTVSSRKFLPWGRWKKVQGRGQKASAYILYGARARVGSHESQDMHALGKFQEVSSMGSMEEGSGKGQKASTYIL